MKQQRTNKSQAVYVLLLMLVVLMGLGGVVAAGFTQDVKKKADHERFLHNDRILKEAKQALLQYAYNYPVDTPGRGPGRLPCPDTDNNGTPDPNFNCINGTGMVGRLPWNDSDLHLYDIRDASGERLWYAVPSAFDHGDVDIINSGITGTITLFDQTGNLIYDGAATGIAAVIIAPGPVTRRDNDANGSYEFTQLRNTGAQQIDPRNYLDTLTGFDNSVFVNVSNADLDGFVLGPIYDTNENQVVVNDQFVVITTAEVIAMAEKATLEAYRDAIDAYHQAIPAWVAPTDYRYPWLEDYASIIAGPNLELYNPATGNTEGRVPFLNYYVDHDSHNLVTDITVDYDIEFNLDDTGPDGGAYLDAFDAAFGAQQLVISNANLTFERMTFDDATNLSTDDLGTLRVHEDDVGASVTTPDPRVTLYFWDGCAGICDIPSTTWQLCNSPATSATDCAMNNPPGPFNFVPHTGDWDDHADIRIRMVTLDLDFDDEFELGLDYSQAMNIVATNAPTGVLHATRQTDITATITDLEIGTDDNNGGPVPGGTSAAQDFMAIQLEECDQDNNVGSNWNPGSYDCMPDVDLNVTPTPLHIQLDITADFFPELPVWVRENRWNDSILMAYDNDFSPGVGGTPACTDTNPQCITVNRDFAGQTTNNIMVLVNANRVPVDENDLNNVFEDDNDTWLDNIFTAQPEPGDDTLLVFDEI